MAVIQNNYATTEYARYAYCVPTAYNALATQVSLVVPGTNALRSQVRLVAYNTTLMRILWEIKSDGTVTNNYLASSEASTDKGVVNLKSDIIEKYWQATGCTSEWIQFDAGAGKVISMDTLALISHNLTGSAVVKVYGYGDGATAAPGSWAAVSVFATLTMSDDPTETNLIYIAPALPANSYRHWRITIEDPTNAAGVIRVGRVVGGASLIFNGENCLDDIDIMTNNFKDEGKLNGFSTIANNRALKKSLSLSFRDLDRLAKTNYRLLRQYLTYCRDTLKALVIVDPSTETSKYQFTVFAKLKQMPRERHKYISSDAAYTSFELEYDEGR